MFYAIIVSESEKRRNNPMANKYCLNCGEPVTPGMARCPVCGSRLSSVSEPSGLQQPVDAESLAKGETSFPSDPGYSKQNTDYNYEDSSTLDLPTFDEEDEDPTEIQARPVSKKQVEKYYEEEEEESPKLSRSQKRSSKKAEKKKSHRDEYEDEDDDDYEDDDYYDDEDDYEYDDNPHTGLIIFLILIIILLLTFSLIFFFKPIWLDKAFSMIGITTHFSSETVNTPSEVSPTITIEASASPSATATVATDGTTPIGSLTINIETVNIRNGAGLSNSEVGKANQNESYNYYETADADGYTWYRIGENQWIADGGDWVSLN